MAQVKIIIHLADFKIMVGDKSTQARYCISRNVNVRCGLAFARRFEIIKFIAIHLGLARTTLD